MCELQLLHVCLQIEVFNILFIREQEKRHVVHCMDCARKQAPGLEGFVCLEEYRMDELCEVFDHFVLHPVVRKKCCCFICGSNLLPLYWIPYIQPCIGIAPHLFPLYCWFWFHSVIYFPRLILNILLQDLFASHFVSSSIPGYNSWLPALNLASVMWGVALEIQMKQNISLWLWK